MVKVQIIIDEKLNRKIEHYKIDYKCTDKRAAIVEMLTRFGERNTGRDWWDKWKTGKTEYHPRPEDVP